jgi:phenylpropionate dioxygenase-like ring-hydroxylating dioxygenase large terminal subunit
MARGSGVEDSAAPLREAWYYAASGRQLRRGRVLARVMLGEPVLIGRDRDGAVFALRDICPHRGMPLSAGHFDGREIECCYHGWRFAADGHCTAIPSLVEGQAFDLSQVGVARYPAREAQGNIWVYFGEDPDRAPDIPRIDGFGESATPRLVETMRFNAAIDHAVVGLMDPAHGPFVHHAWWWRSRGSAHEKTKAFTPSPWGFTMSRHMPSSNSRAYRLLGGAPAERPHRGDPHRPTSGRQPDGADPDRRAHDRGQSLHLLDGAVAQRAEAIVAALCAGLSAPGPRHHGIAAAGPALPAGPVADRRRRHPGALVLPAQAGIPARPR